MALSNRESERMPRPDSSGLQGIFKGSLMPMLGRVAQPGSLMGLPAHSPDPKSG